MTPEERLRQWAEKIKEYGPDLTRWAGLPFIIAECLRMADEFQRLRGLANNGDPQCESQGVDLDHHEADSPPWTCDVQVRAVSRDGMTSTLMKQLEEIADRIVAEVLQAKLAEAEAKIVALEQWQVEARALLLHARLILSPSDINSDAKYTWPKTVETCQEKTHAFLTRTEPPEK